MEWMYAKRESLGVYRLKAVAASLVVFLHVGFPGEFGEVIRVFCRISVPIFFIISGYYSYDTKGYKYRLLDVLKLIVITELLYCIRLVPTCGFYDIVKVYLTWKRWGDLFFVQRFGLCGVGWYLYALLMCYSSTAILKKSKIFYFIPIILLLHMYVQINYKDVDRYTANFWLMGLPFFYLGRYIYTHEKYIRSLYKPSHFLFVFGIGCVSARIESCIYGTKCDLYFGIILVTVASFIFSLFSNNEPIDKDILVYVGKKLSKYIYIFHLFIKETFDNMDVFFWGGDIIACGAI